jgi:PadR family transcriptional regulator PadR
MARDPIDLLHGTLDVLVLKTLSWGPQHGYGISRFIEERTRGVLEIEDAALYKSLHRLERDGSIEAEWGVSENNRTAKYYRLTAQGRSRLRTGVSSWQAFVQSAAKALTATSPAIA